MVILAFLLAFAPPLFAQEESEKAPKPAKLFSSGDTMSVTLTGPWRDIMRNEKNQDPYPAKIEFTDDLGNAMSLDMTAERRGITRQRVCDFPPIKLRFDKEAVKGTTFRGQKSLKMVTHCDRAERYEQYYILEMLAYQMYNLVNDYSFRVRPLEVNYVDSKTGDTKVDKFAFLIEDDSDVAKRHKLKKLKVPRMRVSQLDSKTMSEFALFQYLIGNVDWAALSGPDPAECCHNVKLIGPEPFAREDTAYAIPYDFDSAGLVNAPYAAPPQGLPIKTVTQRLFRGYCRHNDTLEDARTLMLAREADFAALIDGESRLNSNTKKNAGIFIGKFFKIIEDQKKFDRRVIGKCRK
jgi:hypothetical protein